MAAGGTGTIVDRVTARALRRSLEPSADPGRTVEELAALAERRPWVVARALWRLEAAREERPSLAVARARHALAGALAATMLWDVPTDRHAAHHAAA
jgi:hypothetical protein